MKLNIYSIFDTASGLYCRPFFAQSDAEAMRSFSDICQDAEHPVGKHPEDYSCFRIGIFDDVNGEMNNEVNECLLIGLEAIAKGRQPIRENLDLFEGGIPAGQVERSCVLADKDQNYGGTK